MCVGVGGYVSVFLGVGVEVSVGMCECLWVGVGGWG